MAALDFTGLQGRLVCASSGILLVWLCWRTSVCAVEGWEVCTLHCVWSVGMPCPMVCVWVGVDVGGCE